MRQNKLKVISAKDLGKLNLPDFCPRCFWIERHMDTPPAVFPGIFASIDAITKRSTERSFLTKNRPPGWLPIKDVTGVVEGGDAYFKLPVEHGGWVLVGKPDDIFKSGDGAYHIVDYKTAKFTAHQDELFPLYEVQLNCYAFLAQKYGFEPVTKLSLVYCEPDKEMDNDEEFKLSFKVRNLEVDLNLALVPALLIKAREIVSHAEPPLSGNNCKGLCRWVDKVINNLNDITIAGIKEMDFKVQELTKENSGLKAENIRLKEAFRELQKQMEERLGGLQQRLEDLEKKK